MMKFIGSLRIFVETVLDGQKMMPDDYSERKGWLRMNGGDEGM